MVLVLLMLVGAPYFQKVPFLLVPPSLFWICIMLLGGDKEFVVTPKNILLITPRACMLEPVSAHWGGYEKVCGKGCGKAR